MMDDAHVLVDNDDDEIMVMMLILMIFTGGDSIRISAQKEEFLSQNSELLLLIILDIDPLSNNLHQSVVDALCCVGLYRMWYFIVLSPLPEISFGGRWVSKNERVRQLAPTSCSSSTKNNHGHR